MDSAAGPRRWPTSTAPNDSSTDTYHNQVKGDVYLMVQAPITATGLFLRVRGAEHTYFTERRHRDNDVSWTIGILVGAGSTVCIELPIRPNFQPRHSP